MKKNKKTKTLKAQNGLSVFGDPSAYGTLPIDPVLDITKSAGAAYLGNRISSKAYFDYLYPDDKKEADMRSQRSALISGAIGGVSAAVSQFGQRRDYQDYMDRIQRQKDSEYYRLPTDRYAFNEYLDNPYNQSAYKNGGKIRYQDGGEYTGETELEQPDVPTAPREQVYFDSTSPEPSGYYEPEDDYPMTEDGELDFSSFKPTLGSTPLRFNIGNDDVEATISQIAQHESGGRYDVVNTSGGASAINATGKYQFVPKYWHKEIAQFQGTEGKSMEETMEAFKSNPQAQEGFMRHVVNKYYLPEVKGLLPLAKRYGIDQAGLIKMMHYRGIEDTKRRLSTGDFEVSKKEKQLYNNPDILSYVRGQ